MVRRSLMIGRLRTTPASRWAASMPKTGGPQGGRWFWAVLVAPDGTPFNGGAGHAASGKEAREAVEARVPEGPSIKRR
jgi:hypothetical protein